MMTVGSTAGRFVSRFLDIELAVSKRILPPPDLFVELLFIIGRVRVRDQCIDPTSRMKPVA
jgi:hypothetical protein